MKKTILLAGIAILILAVAGAAFFLNNKNLSFGALEVLANDSVVVEVIQGQAKITMEGQEKVLTAPASQEIAKGAKVETLAGGQANIIFSSGSVARLNGATSVDLNDYQSLKQNIKIKLYLNSGNLWSRVQRLLDVANEYEVRTSNTVAVARGTTFNVSRLNNQTKVSVLDSKISVAAIDSQTGQALPGGQTDIEAGNFVQIDSADLPSAQKPLAPQTIAPQDLQQPWYQENLKNDKKIDGALANFGNSISRSQLKEILPAVVLLNIKTTLKKDLLKNKSADAQPSVSTSAAPSASVSPVVSNKPTRAPNPAPVSSLDIKQRLAIIGVSPVAAPGNGYQYTRLTINGAGFSSGCQAFLGSRALQNMKLVSVAVLEGTLGADIAPEVYDISVDCEGQKVVLPKAFNVYKPK